MTRAPDDPQYATETYTEHYDECPGCGQDLALIPKHPDDSTDLNPGVVYGCPTCLRTDDEIDKDVNENGL